MLSCYICILPSTFDKEAGIMVWLLFPFFIYFIYQPWRRPNAMQIATGQDHRQDGPVLIAAMNDLQQGGYRCRHHLGCIQMGTYCMHQDT